MSDINRFATQNSDQQQYHTLSQSTTLVVVRREALAQGLVTDTSNPTIVVQTVAVTHASSTSSFTYEEHFSTGTGMKLSTMHIILVAL
jgi:hypothetical protein